MLTGCCCRVSLQAIRTSLLPDADAPAPSSSQQQPSDLPDALTSYRGGPAFLCIDIKSLGSPARNIAAMPTAPLVYGALCCRCIQVQDGGGCPAGFDQRACGGAVALLPQASASASA
jgi:hypothetical protein